MLKGQEDKARPRIMYSCYAHVSKEGEHFVPEHVLSYIYSGNQEIYAAGKTTVYKPGDLRFFRKNQLARFVKRPPAGGEFKTISIRFDQETLHSISTEYNLHRSKPYTGDGVILLQPNKLLNNYIDSLEPYTEETREVSKGLTEIKVKEAILLLIETNPALKDILFDFSEPGKIDLEAYMNENYKFNVDISRFAYLTGRSLATFKRDFERIYHTSPNRWLQQKRLNDAYFLLKEKGQKVSDVYMDVGFKDLSHFSFAFKKAYGINPSQLI